MPFPRQFWRVTSPISANKVGPEVHGGPSVIDATHPVSAIYNHCYYYSLTAKANTYTKTGEYLYLTHLTKFCSTGSTDNEIWKCSWEIDVSDRDCYRAYNILFRARKCVNPFNIQQAGDMVVFRLQRGEKKRMRALYSSKNGDTHLRLRFRTRSEFNFEVRIIILMWVVNLKCR